MSVIYIFSKKSTISSGKIKNKRALLMRKSGIRSRRSWRGKLQDILRKLILSKAKSDLHVAIAAPKKDTFKSIVLKLNSLLNVCTA